MNRRSQGQDPALVAIVVVNFGSDEMLAHNLAWTAEADPETLRVVVVDNFRSLVDSARMSTLASAMGWELVVSSRNTGFGAAVNRGAERAIALGATVLLLVNPDVTIGQKEVEALGQAATNKPAALASPLVRGPRGEIWSQVGRVEMVRGRLWMNPDHDGPPWISGACLAVHRDFWSRLGGFDDDFFMYWEDVDLSYRSIEAGGEVVLLENVVVTHDVGGTQPDSAAKSPMYVYYNCRNRLVFASKHLAPRDRLRWLLDTPAEIRRVVSRGRRPTRWQKLRLVLGPALAGSVAGMLRLARPAGRNIPSASRLHRQSPPMPEVAHVTQPGGVRQRARRVLILWAEPDSANLGVRALSEGAAHLVRRAFPEAEVLFQGFGPGDSPTRIGSPRAQLRRLVTPRGPLMDWLRTLDLVVDTRAGDSFTDIYGRGRLWTMTLMAAMVRRARVPLVLGPQTIGPFTTPLGRLLARVTLRTAAVVMARDGLSAQAAAKAGRPVDLLTTDVVFSLDRPAVPVFRDVVVNPSGLLWNPNPHVSYESYRRTVRSICSGLLAEGRRLTLLAHVLDSPLVDNDVPVVMELAAELGSGVEIVVPSGLTEVREVLASARVVVGSRMHACLNALSVGRPAIPLAYSRKFQPLLDALGWPHTVDLRGGGDQVGAVRAALDDPELEALAASVRAAADVRIAEAVGVLERAL